MQEINRFVSKLGSNAQLCEEKVLTLIPAKGAEQIVKALHRSCSNDEDSQDTKPDACSLCEQMHKFLSSVPAAYQPNPATTHVSGGQPATVDSEIRVKTEPIDECTVKESEMPR